MDDQILCYLIGPDAKSKQLQTEFALVLTDDPMHRPEEAEGMRPEDCLKLLDGFASAVGYAVGTVLAEYARLGTSE